MRRSDGLGAARLAVAKAHEHDVYDHLRGMGLDAVEFFGQGQLSEEFRFHLKKTRSALRWWPDMVAVQAGMLWLVDAKTGRSDTPHWSLEKAAHEAHQQFQKALSHPLIYVWDDFSCSYLDDLTHEVIKQGVWNGHGSSTDYWLIPKGITRPLSDVFGGGL